MAFAFDTLAYARRLRDGGVPADAAEVHADAAREFIVADLATRSDLDAVRRELETSIATHVDRLETSIATHVDRLETSIATHVARQEASVATHVDRLELLISSHVQRLEAADAALRNDMRDGFASVRRDMAAALRNIEDRITVKMGVMLAASIGIVAALMRH